MKHALEHHDVVYPIFILTPAQVKKNPYGNVRAVSFMCQSLRELAAEIPLSVFEGKTADVVRGLIKKINAAGSHSLANSTRISAIYINEDVSPFAKQRADELKKICDGANCTFYLGRDIFFCRSTELTRVPGHCYLKFTAFYNNSLRHLRKEHVAHLGPSLLAKLRRVPGSADAMAILRKYVAKPNSMALPNYIATDSALRDASRVTKRTAHASSRLALPNYIPGHKAALGALHLFKKKIAGYSKARDCPAQDATSKLGAYIHFGILGPNEIAAVIRSHGSATLFIKQLLWREFYLYIVKYSQTDYKKQSKTMPRRNKIKWQYSPTNFKKWCTGQTGCPIVDAGMRELNATGYMHNRLRMIVATYLIFYLQLDWRLGEKYFAQNLYDYDYANNLGGWMWVASLESWSNDFYKTFSMTSQMFRYDRDAAYVKKWVPELRDVPAKDLYDWAANQKKYPKVKYARPIIADLDAARHAGIRKYQ